MSIDKRLLIIKGAIVSLNHSSYEYIKSNGPRVEYYEGIKKSTEFIMQLIDEQIKAAQDERGSSI